MSVYLVTGAAGFIGSEVAKKLIELGHRVFTIDNLSTGFVRNIPNEAVFIEGDCSVPTTISKLNNQRFDAVFHIAGQSSGEVSFEDPVYDLNSNTTSTLELLRYCQKTGCKRFIYASTMSVYGTCEGKKPVNERDVVNPLSFYSVGKLASENYLKIFEKHGLNTTSLRLFNVYGPNQNMENLKQGMLSIFLAQALTSNKVIVKGNKDRFRDFVYIDDIVESFLRCLENQKTFNQIINVSTGVKTTVENLIETISKGLDKELQVEYQDSTPGDTFGLFGDNSKLYELTGFRPSTKLEDGLRKMISFLREI